MDTDQDAPGSEELVFAESRADEPEAEVCLRAYYRELAELLPDGFDPEQSVSASVEETAPPCGRFLLVRLGGRVLGCGAVKRLSPGVAEVKRMWLHRDLRGRGAGRRLLAELERRARELGAHTVRLDTAAPLEAARRLYRACGYREVPPYNDNPYADHWYEKAL